MEEVSQRVIEDSLRRGEDLELPPSPVIFRRARGFARQVLAERLPGMGERVNTLIAAEPWDAGLLHQELEAGLSLLRPKERRALRGIYIELLPREEVAAALQITSGTLRVLCHRSLKRLRDHFSASAQGKPKYYL